MTLHDERVAIVEIGAVWCHNDETTPIGTSATCSRVWRHVWQATALTHSISPRLHPILVERGYAIHSLQGYGRGVAIATISGTLQVRTVDHITVKRETRHRTLYHCVYGIEVCVGTLKRGVGRVVGIYGKCRHIILRWCLLQPLDTQITEGVMVKFVAEHVIFATCYVAVVLALVEKVTLLVYFVAILYFNTLAGE